MSLTPSLQKIHETALAAAREFKRSEKRLIESLIETERARVHLELGYSSLFQYATECLKLSEATAYNAIAVARKAREIPELISETESVAKQFTGTVGSAAGVGSASVAASRMPIPAAIAHQIRLRDHDRCQAPKLGGGLCGERRWIDLHHLLPVSQGGKNEPENLVTLCRSHHREKHRANR